MPFSLAFFLLYSLVPRYLFCMLIYTVPCYISSVHSSFLNHYFSCILANFHVQFWLVPCYIQNTFCLVPCCFFLDILLPSSLLLFLHTFLLKLIATYLVYFLNWSLFFFLENFLSNFMPIFFALLPTARLLLLQLYLLFSCFFSSILFCLVPCSFLHTFCLGGCYFFLHFQSYFLATLLHTLLIGSLLPFYLNFLPSSSMLFSNTFFLIPSYFLANFLEYFIAFFLHTNLNGSMLLLLHTL